MTMSRARKGASFNLNWNHHLSNWRQLLSLTNLIRSMSRTDRSHVSFHPRISSHPPTILAQPGQAGRTGTPGTCLDATSTTWTNRNRRSPHHRGSAWLISRQKLPLRPARALHRVKILSISEPSASAPLRIPKNLIATTRCRLKRLSSILVEV